MNIEHALVSKLVQTGAIDKGIARGIEPHHFADPGASKIYEILVDHVRIYKTPPSFEAVKKYIEAEERATKQKVAFQFQVCTDSTEYLIDQFVGLIKYRATTESVRDLAKLTDDQNNWQDLDLKVLEVARHLSMIVPSSQVGRLSDVQKRIEEYERRKAADNPWGIKMGIPTLDTLTMGLQPHELATIAGWMGLGKSTLLQFFLFNSYLQGNTPMMLSGEMEAEALFRKWDTMATHMSYTALKALELGEGDMQKWQEWGEKAEDTKPERDIIVIDDLSKFTVDKVYSETVRHNPDVVAVDYIGLMDAPKEHSGTGWAKIEYCTKALKQSARQLKVPHIVVAQTNREDGGSGPGLDKLAGSLSIGRDSDQVYGLFQDDVMAEMEQMEVRLMKSRDSKRGDALLKWKPENMEFRELNASERFDKV